MTNVMERRRSPRRRCEADATLTIGTWPRARTRTVRIEDVSLTGVRLQLPPDLALEPDARVSLHCPALEELNPAGVRKLALEGSVVRGGAAGLARVRFERPVQEQAELAASRGSRRAALAAAFVLAGVMCALKADHLHRFWYSSLIQSYSLLACGFILTRVALSAFYREPADAGYTPSVSLIIAAMNEQDCIAQTVEACLKSRYPAGLMEIIVVDDGSTDLTWERVLPLRLEHENLNLIGFEKNRGKRHAMAAGIAAAKGEILLFVDSDSAPEPDGVYRLMQALADPEVGAASGHIVARIDESNVISKMESIRYYVGHRFIKASESLFGAVTCCPGPFSAYRREIVLKILDGWLNQTFMGVPATFGDDRSLTLRVLKDYRVVFHAGAVCRTNVPPTWRQFFKQQLRWKKSWMRELPFACRLMLTEHPAAAVAYYAGALITLLSPIVLFYSLFYMPLMESAHPLNYVFGFVLSYLCLSLVCYFQTGTPYWYYGPFFGAVYASVLVWQNYYALLTIHKNKWGTR